MSAADDAIQYAMDRGAIWKSALKLLKDGGVEYVPCDVTELAKFLAGDDVPYPISELRSSDDEQSTDSSTEGTE